MKKTLAIITVLLVGSLVLIWVAGSNLPPSHSASVSRIIVAEPQQAFDTLIDFKGYARWLTGVEKVSMDWSPTRKRYTLTDSDGAVTYEVIELMAPTTLKTLIISKDMPYGGSWLFTVESQPVEGDRNVTRVTIQEEGEIYNPAFRFFAFYSFGYTSSMESFLRDLSSELERPGKTDLR